MHQLTTTANTVCGYCVYCMREGMLLLQNGKLFKSICLEVEKSKCFYRFAIHI